MPKKKNLGKRKEETLKFKLGFWEDRIIQIILLIFNFFKVKGKRNADLNI